MWSLNFLRLWRRVSRYLEKVFFQNLYHAFWLKIREQMAVVVSFQLLMEVSINSASPSI
nr:unnamed protein product [Callosobruchus chinensis]